MLEDNPFVADFTDTARLAWGLLANKGVIDGVVSERDAFDLKDPTHSLRTHVAGKFPERPFHLAHTRQDFTLENYFSCRRHFQRYGLARDKFDWGFAKPAR